jgi:hypothetical protein
VTDYQEAPERRRDSKERKAKAIARERETATRGLRERLTHRAIAKGRQERAGRACHEGADRDKRPKGVGGPKRHGKVTGSPRIQYLNTTAIGVESDLESEKREEEKLERLSHLPYPFSALLK